MNRLLELDINNIDEIDEDDLEIVRIIEFGIPRRVYTRENYFDSMDALTFRKRFRLSKETVRDVLVQIEHMLEFPYDINNCVSPINQLLLTLRLFSTGGHLDAVADFAGMHLSTVSRIVVRVSEALGTLYGRYIAMPQGADSIARTQGEFYNIASFPRVIGAIDCTHCRIISPGGADSEVFRNRKGYFSINAQFVCDANLKILSVVARWPGSSHDSTIFNNCQLKRRLDNNDYFNGLLLGDNGYALKPYLMTPLLNPTSEAERQYNSSHIKTRNTIERLFGILKKRFPILSYGCRLKVNTFQTIIVATSILHNIALSQGDRDAPPLPDEVDDDRLNALIANGQIDHNVVPNEDAGRVVRLALINGHFRNVH